MQNAASELNQLRLELFEATKKIEEQNAQLRRLELGVSGMLASGKVQPPAERLEQLMSLIASLARSGGRLAILSTEFCTEVDPVLKQMPKNDDRTLRLKLKQEELQAESRKFSALARWSPDQGNVKRCRLLAVEPELGLAVLPVGLNQGVTSGLLFHLKGKSPGEQPIKLRVVYARPELAAATVVEGKISDLAPGMEAVTDPRNLNQ